MAGKFNFFLKQKIDKLASELKNVIVTCSKSGKLTKELYSKFLKRSLSPYVKKNKFLLIVDSWEGQIDPVLYDNIFEEKNGKAFCTIKVIPSKCTTLCQPCDVYFYRQVKNIIKRLQTALALLKQQREIATRKDLDKNPFISVTSIKRSCFCSPGTICLVCIQINYRKAYLYECQWYLLPPNKFKNTVL